jgi:hypothetical protein
VQATGVDALGWQQVWPRWPQAQRPAVHAPVVPAQVCPSATHRFCQQQLAPLHCWLSQQGWPSPPHGWHSGPKGPKPQTLPPAQVGG